MVHLYYPADHLKWAVSALHPEQEWNRITENGGDDHEAPIFIGDAETKHRQVDLLSDRSQLHSRASVSKACIEIHRITLRDRVDERHDPANFHVRKANNPLKFSREHQGSFNFQKLPCVEEISLGSDLLCESVAKGVVKAQKASRWKP
ncbi:MAG: hypothetical protein ABI882_12390 [Acidobacteriota bacterium]